MFPSGIDGVRDIDAGKILPRHGEFGGGAGVLDGAEWGEDVT
jgi:hypothetical protein